MAELLGQRLRGGEVIELISDLGGGKTTFVRGLAKGLGCKDRVTSPTFKISNEYKGGALTLLHYDFYRLTEPGLMKHELADVLGDDAVVIAVEWAGVIDDVLPAERISVHIKTKDEHSRDISLHAPNGLTYSLGSLAQ